MVKGRLGGGNRGDEGGKNDDLNVEIRWEIEM